MKKNVEEMLHRGARGASLGGVPGYVWGGTQRNGWRRERSGLGDGKPVMFFLCDSGQLAWPLCASYSSFHTELRGSNQTTFRQGLGKP